MRADEARAADEDVVADLHEVVHLRLVATLAQPYVRNRRPCLLVHCFEGLDIRAEEHERHLQRWATMDHESVSGGQIV